MIRSGGYFYYRGDRCVIGAILTIKGRHYMAAASHIFNTGTGSRVRVDGMNAIVSRFLDDYDIALIELPLFCIAENTEFVRAAVLEDALLVNGHHSIQCRVISAGTSLLSLLFPCSDMPEAGDSGSPILQKGKVIGLLSSVMLDNCTGTAVSSDVLRDLCC